jgi:hypothetical protein
MYQVLDAGTVLQMVAASNWFASTGVNGPAISFNSRLEPTINLSPWMAALMAVNSCDCGASEDFPL